MSRKPAARAAWWSWYTGSPSPTARANSRIFSVPTSYSKGGYVLPILLVSSATARGTLDKRRAYRRRHVLVTVTLLRRARHLLGHDLDQRQPYAGALGRLEHE